ncbi:MAG: single-stranded DNA-binding protein [Bacteroidaceae bacterium]|nr:single-stranded DNA-binding protein [Bacteroidaceae bacterium]
MALNKIIVMGRMTADPSLRHTPAGVAVASFTLAVDRDFKDKASGEKQTDFIDVTAWRNTAEFASRYFGKGRMVAVEGRLQMRDWTDKNGNKRRNAEIVADNIYFADSKSGGASDSGTPDFNPAGFSELPVDDSDDFPFF